MNTWKFEILNMRIFPFLLFLSFIFFKMKCKIIDLACQAALVMGPAGYRETTGSPINNI